MGVAGEDVDGNYYRLRYGSIEVSGPTFIFLDTELEPGTTEYITADVPTGDYTLLLQPGWAVEQWDPISDVAVPIEARLISDNPASATVSELSTTLVTYTFYVEGVGPISLGDGGLAVDVDFDPTPPVCDPNVQSCANGMSCVLVDFDTPAFECGPEGLSSPYSPCYGAFDCEMDHACAPDTENFHCGLFGTDCCIPMCDLSAPACPNGESCLALDGTTGICSTN
ncbi:MAG: hypothetical protein KUG77_04845 [Nannocystaceae bacterium]|nr:hypothetical protein [Nannocystaceae bacterium]